MLFTLIEQLFPIRKDYRMVRDASLDELTHFSLPTINEDIVYLLPFTEPLVRSAIHEAKFQHNEKAWTMLSVILVKYLKHRESEVLVLPIPLSAKRERERGYNQVIEIVKKAKSLKRDIDIRTNILFRTRDTRPQTSLSKKERLDNMKGAFGALHGEAVTDKHILILDDVTTTGATLKQARAVLAPYNPASVTLLALAH